MKTSKLILALVLTFSALVAEAGYNSKIVGGGNRICYLQGRKPVCWHYDDKLKPVLDTLPDDFVIPEQVKDGWEKKDDYFFAVSSNVACINDRCFSKGKFDKRFTASVQSWSENKDTYSSWDYVPGSHTMKTRAIAIRPDEDGGLTMMGFLEDTYLEGHNRDHGKYGYDPSPSVRNPRFLPLRFSPGTGVETESHSVARDRIYDERNSQESTPYWALDAEHQFAGSSVACIGSDSVYHPISCGSTAEKLTLQGKDDASHSDGFSVSGTRACGIYGDSDHLVLRCQDIASLKQPLSEAPIVKLPMLRTSKKPVPFAYDSMLSIHGSIACFTTNYYERNSYYGSTEGAFFDRLICVDTAKKPDYYVDDSPIFKLNITKPKTILALAKMVCVSGAENWGGLRCYSYAGKILDFPDEIAFPQYFYNFFGIESAKSELKRMGEALGTNDPVSVLVTKFGNQDISVNQAAFLLNMLKPYFKALNNDISPKILALIDKPEMKKAAASLTPDEQREWELAIDTQLLDLALFQSGKQESPAPYTASEMANAIARNSGMVNRSMVLNNTIAWMDSFKLNEKQPSDSLAILVRASLKKLVADVVFSFDDANIAQSMRDLSELVYQSKRRAVFGWSVRLANASWTDAKRRVILEATLATVAAAKSDDIQKLVLPRVTAALTKIPANPVFTADDLTFALGLLQDTIDALLAAKKDPAFATPLKQVKVGIGNALVRELEPEAMQALLERARSARSTLERLDSDSAIRGVPASALAILNRISQAVQGAPLQ